MSSVLSKFRRSSRGFTHKSFAGKLLTGCTLTGSCENLALVSLQFVNTGRWVSRSKPITIQEYRIGMPFVVLRGGSGRQATARDGPQFGAHEAVEAGT